MAKGSVRKKGEKWYYRFYVEDASGKMVQEEYAGTESKSKRKSFSAKHWKIMKTRSLSQRQTALR